MLNTVLINPWSSIVPYKTAWLLTSHFPKHQSKINKTYWVLQEKLGKLIYDILLWTSTHGHTSVGCPARTYIHQISVDTEYSQEDLRCVINYRDGWRERVQELWAISMTWWWWWWYIYIYIYIVYIHILGWVKCFAIFQHVLCEMYIMWPK